MTRKKTLYELLQVAPNASLDDIQQAHARLQAACEAERRADNASDIDFRIQTLKLALTTLSSPSSRLAYDARLGAIAATAPAALPVAGQGRETWHREIPPEAQALVRQAEAATAGGAPQGPNNPLVWLLSTLKSSLTQSLVFIGLLAVMGMVLQAVFFRSAVSSAPDNLRSTAHDRIVIQEYYQAHGVRPASREEADLLEIENRRQQALVREAERKKQQVEAEQRRFEAESRRRGEQVSEALHRANEEALRQALQSR